MNSQPVKKLRQVALLSASLLLAGLVTPVMAAGQDANWQALVSDAYTRADIVMRGTVQSVDDQTMVDGGHVYSLQVTERQKGNPGERVRVRAGGFFYQVALNKGDSVMMFMKSAKSSQAGNTGPVYSLVDIEGLRPMVFRESGTDARPVDNRLQSEFSNVSSAELDDLLANIRSLED